MGKRIREHDWTATPLGAAERWPAGLRSAVELCLGSGFGAFVWWGPELIQLYNDAAAPILRAAHPAALGRPAREAWPTLAPRLEQVLATGETLVAAEARPGAGPLTISCSALRGEDGAVQGMLALVAESSAGPAVAEALHASEERNRLIVESARDYAILTTDPDGRIESWSPGAEQVFGWTAGEAIGEAMDITFTQQDQASGQPEHERRTARAQGYALDVRWHRRKDGSLVFIDGVTRLLHDSAGEVSGFLKIGQDVTGRRRAEQEREELLEAALRSEERYRLVNRATNDVIWDWDLVTNELVWNEAITSMFGYAQEDVPRTIEFWYEHIHPDDRERITSGVHAVIDGDGSAWQDEYRFRRVNGGYATVLDRGVLARDENGSATRMIGSMLDLTERERLLQSERDARAEAEAANRAKADFLASMSHELRTPLNAIGGYVDLLDLGVHGPLTDDQRDALARVSANQRHLLTLINDVLAFAKLEAGQLEFDLRPLAAGELLAGVEPLVGPLAQAKGIALTVRECDAACSLLADEERVRQILLNLAGNAIKFTGEGGLVELSCQTSAGCVDIHVRDNGPGISHAKQQKIFDPFVQVGRRLSSPQEGVGLGLAISRDLARAMGGELSVRSAEGQGSTFILRLPRAPD